MTVSGPKLTLIRAWVSRQHGMEVVGPALSPEDGPSAGHEPPILP